MSTSSSKPQLRKQKKAREKEGKESNPMENKVNSFVQRGHQYRPLPQYCCSLKWYTSMYHHPFSASLSKKADRPGKRKKKSQTLQQISHRRLQTFPFPSFSLCSFSFFFFLPCYSNVKGPKEKKKWE